MECASPLSELVKCFWGLAEKPLCSIYNLKGNVDSLLSATDSLKAVRNDVKARVEREEEGGGARRTNQVVNWLGKVQDFERGVDQVLQETGERDQIKCVSHCLPRNCRSSYKLGKRVDQLLNEARELRHEKGEFSDFTSPLPPPPPPLVFEMSIDKTVGLDRSLNEVWKWLVDEKEAGVIGLYGTGGVGKTTLMKMINEKLSHANHGFEVVIWVVVSRQVNEDSIRDAIRKKLNIKDESWGAWSRDERVHHLLEVLTQKKFMLLIDDLWARLDLSKIGVPRPGLESQSKVVFTTRLEQVCHQMGANEIFEVKCLTPEEALALFENYVGKSTVDSHPEIPKLAKDIAQECKGLPLALITVGRAMAGISNPHEWKHALTTLQKNPHRLTGMEEEVYRILELSYDRLNDSTLQLCFLYCCLFPEDYHIGQHNLIGLWIGEGLLGNTGDVYSLRNEGEHVLGRLKRACLLESGLDSYGEEYVKMHDVIRDMATWIARDRGQKENKLLVIENAEDISKEMISKWGKQRKYVYGENGFKISTEYHLGDEDKSRNRDERQTTLASPNLVEVSVLGCGLLDLSWLVHAPKLRELWSRLCNSTERIIGDGFAREELVDSGLFSRLELLYLSNLPKLMSICDQVLSFPQGVIFSVWWCHGLRKLPLDSSSARGSFEVEGDQRWWAEFEWDPTARVTLQMGGVGLVEEMTFEKAVRKVKKDPHGWAMIGFLPRGGPSDFGGVSSSDAIEPHLLLLLKEMWGRHRYRDMVDDASRRFYSRHTHRRTLRRHRGPRRPPPSPHSLSLSLRTRPGWLWWSYLLLLQLGLGVSCFRAQVAAPDSVSSVRNCP
ncbi:hypothetical protein NL676_026380 [Syzygium grande]|nr:hypothetical protein NL676_026380 [Syzygium grande]